MEKPRNRLLNTGNKQMVTIRAVGEGWVKQRKGIKEYTYHEEEKKKTENKTILCELGLGKDLKCYTKHNPEKNKQ